jgi:hypothetical protein
MSDHSGQQIVITDHYLVVAKVRESLAVSKQTAHSVHMQRFNIELKSQTGSQLWKS